MSYESGVAGREPTLLMAYPPLLKQRDFQISHLAGIASMMCQASGMNSSFEQEVKKTSKGGTIKSQIRCLYHVS